MVRSSVKLPMGGSSSGSQSGSGSMLASGDAFSWTETLSSRTVSVASGGFSVQTPQFSDQLDQSATFLPGEQGLHFDINPAVLAPHKLSLHLVTYPLHAVTSPSLTNLGPVARLE